MTKDYLAESEARLKFNVHFEPFYSDLLKLIDICRLQDEQIACLRSVLSEWDQDKSCYVQMEVANQLQDAVAKIVRSE